jgi:hypothetical protein
MIFDPALMLFSAVMFALQIPKSMAFRADTVLDLDQLSSLFGGRGDEIANAQNCNFSRTDNGGYAASGPPRSIACMAFLPACSTA